MVLWALKGLAIGKDFDFSTPALPDRDRKDFARLPITRAEERPPQSFMDALYSISSLALNQI